MHEGTDVEPAVEHTSPSLTGGDEDLYTYTDRALLLEIAKNQREMLRLVQQFVGQMQNLKPGDIMKMLLGKS